MSRNQIQLNFDEANRQADVIGSALEKLKRADALHEGLKDEIPSGWRGDNASLFMHIFDQLGAFFRSITSKIMNVENWIRESARRIYEAEMEALRIAEERAYREQQAREAEAARQAEEARHSQEQAAQAVRDFINRHRR